MDVKKTLPCSVLEFPFYCSAIDTFFVSESSTLTHPFFQIAKTRFPLKPPIHSK